MKKKGVIIAILVLPVLTAEDADDCIAYWGDSDWNWNLK